MLPIMGHSSNLHEESDERDAEVYRVLSVEIGNNKLSDR